MAIDRSLTGVERSFRVDEVIVSKTDRAGRITYANDVFLAISGYNEDELLGAAHSIVRHPAMPRCVFKLLWDTIERGDEIFAYVLNRAKAGDHYWVFAHVTPNFGADGGIIGYHSNRRVPPRAAVDAVTPLYASLLRIEQAAADRKTGLEQSFATLVKTVGDLGFASYDRLALALGR